MLIIPNSIMTMYADRILMEKDKTTIESKLCLDLLDNLNPSHFMVKSINKTTIVIKDMPKDGYFYAYCEEADTWIALNLNTGELTKQLGKFLWL